MAASRAQLRNIRLFVAGKENNCLGRIGLLQRQADAAQRSAVQCNAMQRAASAACNDCCFQCSCWLAAALCWARNCLIFMKCWAIVFLFSQMANNNMEQQAWIREATAAGAARRSQAAASERMRECLSRSSMAKTIDFSIVEISRLALGAWLHCRPCRKQANSLRRTERSFRQSPAVGSSALVPLARGSSCRWPTVEQASCTGQPTVAGNCCL